MNTKTLGRRSTLWALAEQGMQSGGNFLSVVVVGRFAGADVLATFGVGLVVALACSVLLQSAVFQPASSLPASQRTAGTLGAIARVSTAILVVVSGLVFVVASATSELFSGATTSSLGVVVAAVTLGSIGGEIVRRNCYLRGNAFLALVCTSGHMCVRLCLLYGLRDHGVDQVIIAFIACGLTSLTALLALGFFSGSSVAELLQILQQRKDWKFFLFAAPGSWITSNSPYLILAAMAAPIEAAMYVATRNLTNIGNVVLELLETHVASLAGVWAGESQKATFARLVKLLGILLFVWALGLAALALVGRQVLMFLYAQPEFVDLGLLLLLWAAIGVVTVKRVMFLYLRTIGLARITARNYSIGAVVSLGVTTFLVPVHGAYGAAIGFVVGVGAVAVANVFAAIKQTRSVA